MQKHINILSRRSFLSSSGKLGLGVALSTLVDIPFVMKRALAEGTIGLPGTNGKVNKILFVFLRGANDSLNSVIPAEDSAYSAVNRPTILIPKDPGQNYAATGPAFDPTVLGPGGATRLATDPTFSYSNAIPLGNGFAALHPSLKFLAPLYNAGQLAVIHRVGYPKQSRSHFDSQNYWETGVPRDNTMQEGIFYRAMLESGLTQTNALTGVSIQSSLPLLLRGSDAAMTNLTDPTRYNLLGIPNNTAGNTKADAALRAAAGFPFAAKRNRDLLSLQYENLSNTLATFAQMDFSDAGNTFQDSANTDGDGVPYYLFPTSNPTNGGYAAHGNDPAKYVVDTGSYGFFRNLKAASMILNKTDAIIAGTALDGFDTHSGQGSVTGSHANLQRRIGWAMYALQKYFTRYSDQCHWDNLIVVTLSEFGRTTIENSDRGTDHAEAGAMFLAGGKVKGGVFGCSPSDSVPWVPGQTGSMFGVSSRYLKRAYDYRSVLGRMIRGHLGSTQAQLDRIIPGYTNAQERLLAGGTSGIDNTAIMGEPNVV